MTIILFLIDTSASMNQRTYLGARKTLLDVAKDAVEKFLKARARDIASRGDRYMLLTFEDPPFNIKAGWKESHSVFMNELKHLSATGVTNMGPAIKNAFDLLNLNRMQSGIDMYGLGRAPYYCEPAMIIVITDGSSLTHQNGVQQTLELPMQNNIVPGAELTREPFRWDQRLFSLVLRLTGSPPAESTNMNLPHDNSPIEAMCAVTAGRSYAVTNKPSIMQSIESLVQKVQSGVVIQFEKISSDPQPLDNEVSRCLVHVLRKNFPVGHWPIPEAYWPDPSLAALPPRTAHPVVKFSCNPTEPHTSNTLPFDKYELESSPLTQYILSRKQPHIAWQVFISNSGRLPGELGAPFGYLKASTNLTCVNLFVLPYNYPIFHPLMEDILKRPQYPGKLPREWRPALDEYFKNMPPYYVTPLKRVFSSLKLDALRLSLLNSLIPDNLEGACFSYAVHTKLKNYKNEAKIQSDRLIQSVQHASKNQNHDAVRVLQCGNNLRSQVESTSYNNMGCTGRPTPAFNIRYSAMKSELNEFPNLVIRVRDKYSAFVSNENSRIRHTFRNPYDIERKDLIDQIHLMRANFMQSPSRIKFKDEDQIHTLPVAQMGNYQDYLKRQPTPLREIESTPVRQHMFGNPFKIDKKGMMVDEADNFGSTDIGSPSQKVKKLNSNQRRRGPIPKDFILLTKHSWKRTSTSSPLQSPSGSRSPSPTLSLEDTNESSNEEDPDILRNGVSTLNNGSVEQNKSNGIIKFSESDLALRRDIFKRVRGPGMNYASVLKTISKLQGEKRNFILEETIKEARRFKRVRLIHQLNLISKQ